MKNTLEEINMRLTEQEKIFYLKKKKKKKKKRIYFIVYLREGDFLNSLTISSAIRFITNPNF